MSKSYSSKTVQSKWDISKESFEKNEKLHFSKIKKLINVQNNPECIVQEGPCLSDGQYRRRRSYTIQHKNSWVSCLEKSKYVKCLFQNCHFIAMSLEDMISHFGHCNGNSSFAKYMCFICRGYVTSEEILKIHMERSHGKKFTLNEKNEKSPSDLSTENIKILKEPQFQTKTNKESSQENLSILTDEPAPRKRGRPSRKLTTPKQSIDTSQRNVEYRNKSEKRFKGSDETSDHINFKEKVTVNENDSVMVKREEGVKPRKRKTDTEVLNENVCHLPLKKNKGDEGETESEKLTEGKKRGRKPKPKPESAESNAPSQDQVRCGKCKDFLGTRKAFQNHNYKKHVGLAWIEGDDPVDVDNEKEVVKLVKAAFKVIKKGTCELCQDVKRSFMGFVSHIQICGKSGDEKDALKVQCPHCSAKCLKYSMPVHIKLSHSDLNSSRTDETGESDKKNLISEEPSVSSGKRRSAIKAAHKFQEVLKEIEEPESIPRHYVFYQKGSSTFPKMCTQLINCWYKCQREKIKITCRHTGCTVVNDKVIDAKHHHYTCPQLPDSVYMCEACEFYSVNESDLPSHISTKHSRILKRKKNKEEYNEGNESEKEDIGGGGEEEEESDDEDHEDSNEDVSDLDDAKSLKKKKKTKKKVVGDGDRKRKDFDEEMNQKKLFCRRENLESDRKFPFFRNSMKITLEDELKENECFDSWPEFSNSIADWKSIPFDSASEFLPMLDRSISVGHETATNSSQIKWKRFNRFEGDVLGGVPTIFAGGSVRCMSWCKISYHRSLAKNTKQYLALATTKHINHLRNIQDRSESSQASLLQIWDCGPLGNHSVASPPKFALGIRHEGEIWDLDWFPEDTWKEGSDKALPRLGLLATAGDDGIVRIWSICDPDHLTVKIEGFPIYETHPMAKLVTDEDLIDSCFRLSIGKGGIVAGGYANGIVAFWNLNTIDSPFCEKEEKCHGVIRPFLTIHAHKTAIITLKFCPNESRYICTGALDRVVKFWDLESSVSPMEQFSRELCLGVVWPKHWPLVICNFDDSLSFSNKGTVKYIRDVFYDKHYSCLVLDGTCLSLSFSDWLNAVCGSNNIGDVRLCFLPSFINSLQKQKKITSLSSLKLRKLEEEEENEESREKKEVDKEEKKKAGDRLKINNLKYEEINSGFGLVFSNSSILDKTKLKERESNFLGIQIRAVNKVCFNPNFKCFTHVAAGYNCGFVRILKLQSNNHIKDFIEKHEKLL